MSMQKMILGFLFILPVAAAQYYSIDGGVLTFLSAILSVCMWVVLITTVSAKITDRFLRLIFEFFFSTLLAIYVLAQLVSYYLQGTYFNIQFFFHVNVSSVTETWRTYYSLILMVVGFLASIWLLVWLNRTRPVADKKSGLAMLLILVLAFVFDPGLRTSSASALQSLLIQKDKSLDSIEWKKLRLDRRALDNNLEPALPGKNLVMIFLEGFSKLYTDEALFPGLTPNILALNSQGWQLNNLSGKQLGTDWTMGGLVSSLCGTPLLHEWEFSGNNILLTEFLNRAVCLPDILHQAGYQQTFMGGASLGFAGKGVFLKKHSFDHVYGRSELTPRLPDPSYLSGWGLYDDSLFDIAVKEFDAYSQKKEPFNLTLLTIDTHHPTGNASRSCPKYNEIDNSILHAVHCTDYLLGRFVEKLQSNPAYSNTLVVLVSDHFSMRNDAFPLFPRGFKHDLYFNVLNSGLHGSSNISATPMDIAPTVLSLLGVKHNSSFLAGNDILSSATTARYNEQDQAQRDSTLSFLNSNYLTSHSKNQGKSFFLDPSAYEFQNDIANVKFANGKVTFTVTGNDPFLILPKIDNPAGGPIKMIINLDAPGATNAGVRYLTGKNQIYSSDRARDEEIKAGNNAIVFPLPADADYGRIRVDPGSIEGEYTIHSIEMQL